MSLIMDKHDYGIDLDRNFSSRVLKKRDVLFREGDTLGDGYIINYGEISLERNNKKVEILGQGEVLGVFNVFFDNKVRFFTAIAIIPTEVLVIPENYLKQIINKADPFVKHCFRNWLHLTRKFMVELNYENNVKDEEIKTDEELEEFKKVKLV